MLSEPFFRCLVLRTVLLHEGSELRAMVEMHEMSKLVDDDIVQYEERKLREFSIEDQVSL